jgi:hypothetical protein
MPPLTRMCFLQDVEQYSNTITQDQSLSIRRHPLGRGLLQDMEQYSNTITCTQDQSLSFHLHPY